MTTPPCPCFQGTCLSLLNQLLVSEDDNDYLRTIIKIPTAPLLQYLEPRPLQGAGQEDDSGCENNPNSRRDTMETRCTSAPHTYVSICGL